MAKSKNRMSNEINAGSMADIAFLLLIFFLVTTTMDVDTGIIRVLPPIPPENQPPPPDVNKRNVFVVLVNANDQLLVEDQISDITVLRTQAKEFIKGYPGQPDNMSFPAFENEEIPNFGTMPISKQIISLQNDNGTSYNMYINVQNELAAAYNELRDELARSKFGMSFEELSTKEPSKAAAIKKIYPARISEAEPKETGQGQQSTPE
jgi:biopolymer transport protein ExbD